MIDIKPFCSTDKALPYLMQPWSRGAYTYATDGYILVRVARRDDVPENSQAPDAEKLLEKVQIDTASFTPLPPFDLPPEKMDECASCGGSGYEHDCPNCNCICKNCNGSGEESHYGFISVGIFGLPYASRYIAIIRSLPGVEISRTAARLDPMPFRFDGGIGLLMPLTRCSETHIEVECAQ